ncbi:TetR/AcrR family transcriptional regulator [Aureispira anguillae]|uniref:TetR/AcrR family transcriptional regulator n=1 Tax=Aureispira anguillae TaxID=2864201 RepID=A0A915YJ25_9BACT|nr:TetR/AcrR family transcriptional regulator [Aureispira anguillae]BDS13924.1 TetR/AcrR family transcriptional regulator [Aureispira anguillae]
MESSKQKWIKKGYETYALAGYKRLKIESLARVVGVSKSSFYHHFADLECFSDHLFEHHFKMCLILAEKERNCASIYPDLINILVAHKVDLLFHRQLRIHRHYDSVQIALSKANKILGNYATMLWAKQINLKLNTTQLEGLFELATDDFYMNINKDNLCYNSLKSYFQNLSRIINRLT